MLRDASQSQKPRQLILSAASAASLDKFLRKLTLRLGIRRMESMIESVEQMIRDTKAASRALRRKIKTPAQARAFLIEAGILKKDKIYISETALEHRRRVLRLEKGKKTSTRPTKRKRSS